PHGAVERRPDHHLGERELLSYGADLPHALVGLVPVALEPVQARLLHRPRVVIDVEPGAARDVQRVHQLAVDVELALPRGGGADPDGPRARVAGQPGELALLDPALAGDAVEDLQLRRLAGDRPDQPVDRSDAADQRDRLGVADDRVILDAHTTIGCKRWSPA